MKKTKQNSLCLRYISRMIVVCFTLFYSCANHPMKMKEMDYKLLKEYLTTTYHYTIGKSICGIVVLSEQGCPGCNRTFANSLSQQIGNPKLLFVIPATGNSIDISNFIKSKSENIFFDPKDEISELFNLNGSSYISVLDQRVDTIMQMDANNLASNLVYLTHLAN